MPPSRLEMLWVLREPTTEPSEWVTSSISAKADHASRTPKKMKMKTERKRAPNLGLRE